jgi:hypothetical protein
VETIMIVLKGLVVAGLVSGILVLFGGGEPSTAASPAAYYPDATLPTLFQPMRH